MTKDAQIFFKSSLDIDERNHISHKTTACAKKRNKLRQTTNKKKFFLYSIFTRFYVYLGYSSFRSLFYFLQLKSDFDSALNLHIDFSHPKICFRICFFFLDRFTENKKHEISTTKS